MTVVLTLADLTEIAKRHQPDAMSGRRRGRLALPPATSPSRADRGERDAHDAEPGRYTATGRFTTRADPSSFPMP